MNLEVFMGFMLEGFDGTSILLGCRSLFVSLCVCLVGGVFLIFIVLISLVQVVDLLVTHAIN